MAGGLVSVANFNPLKFKEFSQVARSGRTEAVVVYHGEASLYCIRESMGSQWRDARGGEVWSVWGATVTR